MVGSGIASGRLSPGDTGLQLLENAMATAAALVVLILALGPVSGAHLNPAVTLANRLFRRMTTAEAAAYIGAQVAGGAAGTLMANVMFGRPVFELAVQARGSGPLWTSEVVATFGLVFVIFALVRADRTVLAPYAVGAYIGGAMLFTSSTSFANPALTVARALSDSFTGIAPSSVPAFVIAQVAGTVLAAAAVRALYPPSSPVAQVPGGQSDLPRVAARQS